MVNAKDSRLGLARSILLAVLAAGFCIAGIEHFRMTNDYAAIVPTWVPNPRGMVIFTGWCELFGAAGLLVPRLRKLTGVMLVVFMLCVFPANIRQAFEHVPFRGHPVGWEFTGPRLALEPVLIWWPLYCTGIIDWPFRRSASR